MRLITDSTGLGRISPTSHFNTVLRSSAGTRGSGFVTFELSKLEQHSFFNVSPNMLRKSSAGVFQPTFVGMITSFLTSSLTNEASLMLSSALASGIGIVTLMSSSESELDESESLELEDNDDEVETRDSGIEFDRSCSPVIGEGIKLALCCRPSLAFLSSRFGDL